MTIRSKAQRIKATIALAPSAIAFAFWWFLIQALPFGAQLFLGRCIGFILYKSNSSRKRIAKINIKKCFPAYSAQEQEQLLKENLQSTACGFFESGAAWFWPDWRLKNKYQIQGMEHLEHAQKQNKGVLFMGIHFTAIEIGAAFINIENTIDGFYRPHKNLVYERIQAWGRTRRNPHSRVIPNGDIRAIIKSLRNGRAVNYAPDQDYGRRRSVFAPFFNISTATVKATPQIASAGRAEVIPWVCHRKSKSGQYTITIYPSISTKLGAGEKEDATIINSFIEERILEQPEQYLWVHRRFKTRPENEQSFY